MREPGPPRGPADVPDDVSPEWSAADLLGGTDTDGDGRADTLLTDDGDDLLVLTDLDSDGLADRALRIGPDGAVQGYGDDVGDDTGTGSVAARSLWAGFLGRLLGPGP